MNDVNKYNDKISKMIEELDYNQKIIELNKKLEYDDKIKKMIEKTSLKNNEKLQCIITNDNFYPFQSVKTMIESR